MTMSRATHHIIRLTLLAGIISTAAGCSMMQPVQAWEKGTLARPDMTFGSNVLETKYSEHIYTSREGASGGSGVGGGGCGCN